MKKFNPKESWPFAFKSGLKARAERGFDSGGAGALAPGWSDSANLNFLVAPV
jgi:hypothetical protein